ncbi:MAG: Uma2 family endonuclease [Okeania sp. SIO3I5]|uniref:Uma2 family endonuclease n=1 Tax=Okeania sp. SIO3I5 TaxID=2607805 RepID=UPI0013BD4646|nr:Uma2 family endonuclease [Okeania sp. SIO3I5]NEQ39126.1 Uma2 family endonuclease [Okeania sp. SIO3I5]
MSNVTVKDLEILQTLAKEAGFDYQFELESGKILVMGPSDIVSSEITMRLGGSIYAWVNPRRLGRVFDSAGGFILPDSNLKAPDVSFVKAERLRRSIRYFAEMVPDLAVEIKSQSDNADATLRERIPPLQKKLKKYIELGVQVAILIDPDEETVAIYRPTGDTVELAGDDILTIPELFPGWEISISELWPPIFEEEE